MLKWDFEMTTKVKIVFKIVEFHTIEREVDSEDLAKMKEEGDVLHWLEDQFTDDPKSESVIETVDEEAFSWREVK